MSRSQCRQSLSANHQFTCCDPSRSGEIPSFDAGDQLALVVHGVPPDQGGFPLAALWKAQGGAVGGPQRHGFQTKKKNKKKKPPVVLCLEASASSPGAARQAVAGGDGRLRRAASSRLSRPAGGARGVDELLLFFLLQEAA